MKALYKLTLEKYANHIVHKYLECAFANDVGVFYAKDSKFVHEMRVSLRRVFVALKIFASVLGDRGKSERKLVKILIKELGNARDLDIYISIASETDQAKNLVRLLEQKRLDEQKQLISVFARHSHAIANLSRPYHQGNQDDVTIGQVYEKIVKKRLDKFHRFADGFSEEPSAKDCHALRKLGKELHYTLEFFAPLRKDKNKKITKIIKALLHDLGRIHDLHSVRLKMHEMIGQLPCELSTITKEEISGEAARCLAIEQEQRGSVIKNIKKIGLSIEDILMKFK